MLASMCPCDEILYGGARGGGKSDWLLGEFIRNVEEYGVGARGIIVRKSFPQLEEIESRLLMLLGPHYGYNAYRRGSKTWYLPTVNGTAELRLRAIEERDDVLKHLGHQYNFIGVDELTLFPDEYVLEQLKTSLRSPYGAPCYVRLTTNPGHIGHDWVKKRFRIGIVPPMQPFKVDVPGGPSYTRVFIPAKVDDNKILMRNDPHYKARLQAIPDPLLRRAYLMGDWNIALGAAFPEFNPEIHVIPTFDVPTSVRVWRAMDWGYAKPYACLWFFEMDGNIYVCGELYGMGAKYNEGARHDPDVVWQKIVAKEAAMGVLSRVRPSYLDPQCWAKHGNTTIVKLLGGSRNWTPWHKSDESRTNQKMNVHQWLRVVNGESRLKVMDCCTNLIRIMGSIQTDPKNPEDVDTDGEDHIYDALRAGLDHKPFKAAPPPKQEHQASWLAELEARASGGSGIFRDRGGW